MTRVIGITGGIASGKSTVTAYLREKGYTVIDADGVVHELQAKGGKLYQILLADFGPTILDQEGYIDRQGLSQLVFSDPSLRKHLSSLQDAIIRQELLERRDRLRANKDIIFMDIPLLYEAGYEQEVDEVWLVYVERETQLKRLMRRNGYSFIEAQQRLQAQFSLEEKKKQTNCLIDNGGSIKDTFTQVEALLQERR